MNGRHVGTLEDGMPIGGMTPFPIFLIVDHLLFVLSMSPPEGGF